LGELGEHVCGVRRDEVGADKKRKPDMLRVDIKAAGTRTAAYGTTLSARSPMLYSGELNAKGSWR
jgi:hypothetical protein